MATNTIFTGSSQYSQDFQNVITRAVNIASLPITQLNTSLASLQGQSSALAGLDSKFASLQSAIQGIQNGIGGTSYYSTLSKDSVVSVNLSDGAVEGSYTVKVVDAGAYQTSMTTTAWNNAPGSPKTYELWIGAQTDPNNKIDITPADNTAQSVATAINAAAGSKVRAVAVNVGSADDPDWRISMQATTLGKVPLDIVDGGNSLQTQTDGRQAQYEVNNSGKTVTSTTRSVEIATGIRVNLLASSTDAVTINVNRSSAALSRALTDFANAYNSVVDGLDQQRGDSKGALSGNSILYQLTNVLSGVATYSQSGSEFTGLRDVGLELGSDGHLTFNSATFAAADQTNPAGMVTFLGRTTSGGFLKAASDLMTSVEDSSAGILKNLETSIAQQITHTSELVSTKQQQVDQLQERLQRQMAAADAAIASMEQRYNYISGMFEAMQTAAKNR